MNNINKDGFVIINKPKGITSFDVIRKVRNVLKIKKIGHSGTLDKNAHGVLVLGVGKATKLLNINSNNRKEYIAKIEIGRAFDTIDPTGTLIDQMDTSIINIDALTNDIDKTIEKLKNQKEQIPPKFSAIKINGKRVSDIMRSNKNTDIELKSRNIVVDNISRISNIIRENNYLYFEVKLNVRKGYYVRSFVNDLSYMLNVPMNMYDLLRTNSEGYDIAIAQDIADDLKIIPIND